MLLKQLNCHYKKNLIRRLNFCKQNQVRTNSTSKYCLMQATCDQRKAKVRPASMFSFQMGCGQRVYVNVARK